MTMGRSIRKSAATFGLYFACIALCYPVLAQDIQEDVKVLTLAFEPPKGKIGEDARFNCTVSAENATVEFLFKGQPILHGNRTKITTAVKAITEKPDPFGNAKTDKVKIANMTIKDVTKSDAGNYTCLAKLGDLRKEEVRTLDLSFKGRLVNSTAGPLKLNITKSNRAQLYCLFEVYDSSSISGVSWYKKDQQNDTKVDVTNKPENIKGHMINNTHDLNVGKDGNGTYVCEIHDSVANENIRGEIDVMVLAPPEIVDFKVIPINTTEIYISWKVLAYNSDIKSYNLYTREGGNETQWRLYVTKRINAQNNSFVLQNLKKSTQYQVKLEVSTSDWAEPGKKEDTTWVTTLDKEPVFVPNISIKGFSATSVTIGWPPPPDDIAHLIHIYILQGKKKESKESPREAAHLRDNKNLPYMFSGLDPHSTYVFQVRACSDYTDDVRRCGPWSDKMEAATLDGIPGKPSNVRIECSTSATEFDHAFMNLTWESPEKPNAEIKGYFMELTGNSTYRDRYGTWKEDTWGPRSRFMTNDSRSARFDDLEPNTNYTVRLSAMTRTRRRGEEEARGCGTPPAAPIAPPRPRWRKILENNRYMFKMFLPRITERNGPICCYRVHMVRMLPNTDWKNLPNPKDIPIIDYEDAHHPTEPALGAYITDVFSNDKFPPDSEVILGDKSSLFSESHILETDPSLAREACRRCLERPRRVLPDPTTTSTTTTPTTTEDQLLDDDVTGAPPEEDPRARRAADGVLSTAEEYLMIVEDANNVPERFRLRRSLGEPNTEELYKSIMRDNQEPKESLVRVNDGYLDSKSNYTMFVELIPGQPNLPAQYSAYVNTLMPAPSPPVPVPSTALELALQVTCAVAGVVLLAMIIFCVLQTRKSRKLPPHATVEMNRIQQALRYVVGHIGGRQQLLSTVPPDMPPIAKEDLAAAYAERQVDSDYGFQKEFEMLPECFPDRTTHASEARENQPKNRYPDIKAYDQTRVKLAQVDSVTGSDYINANYVMGYRERKQFICAQGPTDTTVNDFWRMIWEHGLELIVMLTNLEEYSKVKCSKYWPDEVRGSRAFGAVTVHHVSEKRYSDYIVRELRITKQPTNSEGQPIVENNGVAKRNGDCKDASDSSAPTSPREAKETEGRIVRQYHFLMWKDFAAPEHPHSILKFIKRVNEAWLGMVGRPVVVHCSAGVGRTGTLVALDCLLEQLRATGQASVFNTVAELRRQRNFLVQSLKQYVFVYRALVEWAHYGDTEIPASRLKAAVDRLRNTPEGQGKCLMEHEFEKMMNSPVAEPVKSCAAGAAEEVRNRNRSQECLPYDRNRVILTPLPGRDFSTYINASFIEAYDNSEGFIITQDPLPNTIMDFWRMVSEHNVSTIVMLSEIGEGKCPRYWDDGTAQYEHISVQYEESESCPYYTRRQFRVTNNKNGDTSSVLALQYQGWPTAPGHVPEVTRGLADLADAARLIRLSDQAMLVHCHLGTERSALFVALCILIYQLRVERRVDVNVVARKVRSQRQGTIDTVLQYEFLHRAILNYAELHNLLEDS